MADFAPNVTPRYRLHYHIAGRAHTIQMRTSRNTDFTVTETRGIALMSALFTALAPALFDDLSFLSAEIALTDSDLFFPAGTPAAVVGGVPVAQASKQDSITHLTFTGRGSLGSKVSLHVYGRTTSPDTLPANATSDFVLFPAEAAEIGTAIQALNAPGSGIVTVDNTKAVFPLRATLKVNDFWLRQVRKGL